MKKLKVTIDCDATYVSQIYVPDNMTLEEAIKYAEEHIGECSIGELEHLPYSDRIDKSFCWFEY